jgi:SAM-dependent methyltransferase
MVRGQAWIGALVSLFSAIGKQLQHPKGPLGKVLFRGMTKSTIAHARWTIGLMEIDRDDDILEVGFGNGANIELLAKEAPNGHITGVEVSKTALEMASKKNAAAISEGRVTLHLVTPGQALPLEDQTFDKACTIATMYVIADPATVFREMHRVLEPGGLAAVTFPVREKFMRFPPTKAEGFHFHELADLEAAFRNAGFTDTRTERNDSVKFGAHCMLGRKAAASR